MSDDNATTKPPEAPWESPRSAGRSPEPSESPPGAPAPLEPPRYSVDGEVARGGLGRILEGYDHRLGRAVAIKELLVSDPALAQRFVREALITARLQHPSIVPVYDFGRWASGDPFYAMKLVSGRSFDQVIRDSASLAERIALVPVVLAVAEAIAYAHHGGVIHRDLKPGNVLVGEFGETIVIDWGLAKVLGGDDRAEPAPPRPAQPALAADLTEVGSVVGTPAYMPPEQAAGRTVDARADVYAIGAILYHLLAGSPPYDSATGSVVGGVLAGPPVAVDRRVAGVPRELCTIVAKAMARDPADRYPSARELAEDLKRFQTGQLVAAHRYSTGALVRRWLRRHRLPVLVAGVALAVLAAGAAAGIAGILREKAEATRQRERAERRANELRLSQGRAVLDVDPTAAVAWLKQHRIEADTLGAARALALEAHSRGVARSILAHGARPMRLLVLPDGSIAAGADDGGVTLWAPGQASRRLGAHDGEVTALAIAGDTLVSTGVDGTVRTWGPGGRVLRGHEGPVWSVHALGSTGAVTTGADGAVRLWDLATGSSRVLGTHARGGAFHAAVSPDGNWVATSGRDGVKVWSTTGAASRILDAEVSGAAVAFLAGGTAVAIGDGDGRVRIVPVGGGAAVVLSAAGQRIQDVVAAPSGQRVAASSYDGTVRVWDAGGLERGRILVGGAAVLSWSPDGRHLCAAGVDGTARLWSPDAAEVRTLRGHAGILADCAFSPDGRTLVTAGNDRQLRLWDVPADPARGLATDGARVTQLAFSPDGHELAATTGRGGVWIWDAASGAGGLAFQHRDDARAAAFSPDGAALATGGGDGRIALLPHGGGSERVGAGHEGLVTALAFSADGRTLASGGRDSTVRLWDAATMTGRVVARGEGWIMRLAFSPDGSRLAAASEALLLVDLPGGTVRRLEGHGGETFRIAFSPDGETLASGSVDGTARLWSADGSPGRVFAGHSDVVFDVAFSPDGRNLATSSWDRTIRIWDVASGRSRELSGHTDQVYDIAFSRDGRRLASASNDGSVRVWDLTSGSARVLRHPTPVKRVAISPDGRIASAGEDGVVRLWSETTPPALADAAALTRFLDEITTAVIGADERPVTPPR